MSSSRKPRSASTSPVRGRRSRSLSRSTRIRLRIQVSADAENPGNNLFVTGLPTWLNDSHLHKYLSKKGKVIDCHLLKDRETKEYREVGFVTMETIVDAERCIKYLNHTFFEGRPITVKKAKRSGRRTQSPGRYRGSKDKQGHGSGRSCSYSPMQRQDRDYYSSDRRERSRSPYRKREEEEDYSDKYRRRRD